MNRIIFFLSILLLLTSSWSCQDSANQQATQASPAVVSESGNSQAMSKENDAWLRHFNTKSKDLQQVYAQEAVRVLADGKILNGNVQIADHLLNKAAPASTIHSEFGILANKEMAIEYEIIATTYESSEKTMSLVIWQTSNEQRKRVFEFEVLTDPNKIDLEEIARRRKEWMALCNQHNAKALIQEMYTENTIYFNHKPCIQGREELEKVYQYMNKTNYSLTLKSEVVKPVNGQFVFEIGQCSGSYGGKYVLIWKKDVDGAWRIFIDSNI